MENTSVLPKVVTGAKYESWYVSGTIDSVAYLHLSEYVI
jgi:hypothetical protein